MPRRPITALEFYSGIGGMHYALQRVCPDAVVLDAFDVNPAANGVYQHNFGHTPRQVDLATLTAAELDAYGADLWLMAPPCQPFTRQGKQLGGADTRSSSFLQLLEQLQRMQQQPQGVLVENVVGFQGSDVHQQLLKTLKACSYHVQDFILTPLQYGVPYSRPRYFCVASKQPLPVPLPLDGHQQAPCLCPPALLLQLQEQGVGTEQLVAAARQAMSSHGAEVPSLRDFLGLRQPEPVQAAQQQQQQDMKQAAAQDASCPQQQQQQEQQHPGPRQDKQGLASSWVWVPDKVLQKYADVIDVVAESSRSCNCFTKAYGHFARGTGSLLATVPDPSAVDDRWQLVGGNGSLELRGYQPGGTTDDSRGSSTAVQEQPHAGCAMQETDCEDGSSGRLHLAAAWHLLHLRYFTPFEVAQLHSFPAEFSLPDELGCRQAYQLLGNSLSVAVVVDVLSYLLHGPSDIH